MPFPFDGEQTIGILSNAVSRRSGTTLPIVPKQDKQDPPPNILVDQPHYYSDDDFWTWYFNKYYGPFADDIDIIYSNWLNRVPGQPNTHSSLAGDPIGDAFPPMGPKPHDPYGDPAPKYETGRQDLDAYELRMFNLLQVDWEKKWREEQERDKKLCDELAKNGEKFSWVPSEECLEKNMPKPMIDMVRNLKGDRSFEDSQIYGEFTTKMAYYESKSGNNPFNNFFEITVDILSGLIKNHALGSAVEATVNIIMNKLLDSGDDERWGNIDYDKFVNDFLEMIRDVYQIVYKTCLKQAADMYLMGLTHKYGISNFPCEWEKTAYYNLDGEIKGRIERFGREYGDIDKYDERIK